MCIFFWCRISSTGLLVKVEAASPLDGQNATLELHSVAALLAHTREYRQLLAFPGPLKPRETHKNDVIKFCERKIHESRQVFIIFSCFCLIAPLPHLPFSSFVLSLVHCIGEQIEIKSAIAL